MWDSIDPDIMALNFYSPLFLLLFKNDTIAIDTAQAKQVISHHLTLFTQNYATKNN